MSDQYWHTLTKSLTEDALILRLKSNEHDFVERKPRGQAGEWRQVAVAFANSAPIGWPSILFVGVNDDGIPQCKTLDQLEKLIRSVSDTLDNAYPAIYRHIVPLSIPGEGLCLAVIIPGSPARPHFAGQSYIRVGDQTKLASNSQFDELIAQRNSKAATILKSAGKEVTWVFMNPDGTTLGTYGVATSGDSFSVLGCNAHFATFQKRQATNGQLSTESFLLTRIELSFDHVNNRLQIHYYRDR